MIDPEELARAAPGAAGANWRMAERCACAAARQVYTDDHLYTPLLRSAVREAVLAFLYRMEGR